jgi:hypothetical protein
MTNMDETERDGLDEGQSLSLSNTITYTYVSSVLLPVDCRINQEYPEEHDRNHWFEDSRILDDVGHFNVHHCLIPIDCCQQELNSWFFDSLPIGCRLTVSV